ncbi:hypothetical protein [Pseudalkalibacillus sp. NRS-1564]|uniref:hypothetical protein n=1 Tax=Pseudalkalibacillus sp. NRS-1564 TaxID=3233900 RepID=UPI003D26E484
MKHRVKSKGNKRRQTLEQYLEQLGPVWRPLVSLSLDPHPLDLRPVASPSVWLFRLTYVLGLLALRRFPILTPPVSQYFMSKELDMLIH